MPIDRINTVRNPFAGMPSYNVGHLVSSDEQVVKEDWSNTDKEYPPSPPRIFLKLFL